MNPLIVTFAIVVIALAALVFVDVGLSRRRWLQLSLTIAFGVALPIGYLGLTEFLGRPKPVATEWLRANTAEADVIASHFIEGEAIWLWLMLPDEREPRAYVLPWSQKTAEQLEEARQSGQGTRARFPFNGEPTLDDGPAMFYALPQEALPDKTVEQQAPAMEFKS